LANNQKKSPHMGKILPAGSYYNLTGGKLLDYLLKNIKREGFILLLSSLVYETY
jgi:hypothetical protein